MSDLLRCQACGGAVVWDATQAGAACLFCATVALEVEPATPDSVPDVELHLPATVPRDAAERSFRRWATRSWFRPRELDTLSAKLRLLWLPAWRVDARLETHWAGLRPALGRAGKKPVAGVDHVELRHMVPASQGLDEAELGALQPFDETDARPWDAREADGDTIWEPPALSRRGATARARRALIEQHRRAIARANGLLTTKVSALVDEQDMRLMLLPVYIGSFRFRDRPWRFVVNAQSGVVVGEAPLDRRKVALVVVAILAAVALLVWAWS